MNSTVNGTDLEVRDYVAGVRAALADLPAEDVEEFTTGMEADLAERLAEPGDGTLRDRLGEPDAYAAELRSAAGLPPRVVASQPKKPVAQRLSGLWSDLCTGALKAMPWLSDLRPLWWAVRGFALVATPMWLLDAPTVFFGMIGALVSVVLGLLVRQRVLKGGWIAPVRVIGNIAAVILLPVAFLALLDRAPTSGDAYYGDPGVASVPGLANNGESVANVYAYDETGRRIDKFRLFDQNGRPLIVDAAAVSSFADGEYYEQSVDPDTGEPDIDFKVFPLRWATRTGWEPMSMGLWEPPMAITPLPGPVPNVEASPTPTPTGTPTTSPSPGASVTKAPATPQTSPSSGVSATPTPTASGSPSASR